MSRDNREAGSENWASGPFPNSILISSLQGQQRPTYTFQPPISRGKYYKNDFNIYIFLANVLFLVHECDDSREVTKNCYDVVTAECALVKREYE